MLNPGDSVDIWVVEAQLGAGSPGSVYRVHERDAPNVKAAVKVFELPAREAPGYRERFVREAELTSTVDHPNVVKVRSLHVDHEPPYLEMELIEGATLEDLLKDSPLSLHRALSLMTQAADALNHLHEHGVRHRDIKPANLLVTDSDQLKLVDFGLAMDADPSQITENNVSFGTVAYAPPEWVDAEQLDSVAWDTYAMGVVFWEMLTGRVAFPTSGQGSARQEAMAVILGKQGHEPLDSGDVAPTSLRELIRDMTHSTPSTRLTDAGVILARLRAIDTAELASTVSRTTPVPRSPPVPNVSSFVPAGETHETARGAGRVLTALVVLLLFALAAGISVSLFVVDPSPPPPSQPAAAKP